MDERFANGALGDETSFVLFAVKGEGTKSHPPETATGIANIPMWLTDDGIECAKGRLSYAELAQELRELHHEAEKLATIRAEMKKSEST
jgi:hypothetical protein